MNDALDQTLNAALGTNGVDCGGIYLVDARTGALDLIIYQGLPPSFVESAKHYPTDTPQARLVMAGKPVYARYDQLRMPGNEVRAREGLRALAIIPILHEGQVIAALNLASHIHDDIPTYTRRAIETIAAQIGSVIARINAEQSLRVSQRNLQSLFDRITDFLFILDRNGCIEHANQDVTRCLGYSPAG